MSKTHPSPLILIKYFPRVRSAAGLPTSTSNDKWKALQRELSSYCKSRGIPSRRLNTIIPMARKLLKDEEKTRSAVNSQLSLPSDLTPEDPTPQDLSQEVFTAPQTMQQEAMSPSRGRLVGGDVMSHDLRNLESNGYRIYMGYRIQH